MFSNPPVRLSTIWWIRQSANCPRAGRLWIVNSTQQKQKYEQAHQNIHSTHRRARQEAGAENQSQEEVMSNLVEHAKIEFGLLMTANPDDELVITPFIPQVLALVEAFGDSGQSGGSAPFTANCIISVLKKLMAFEPLSPLRGDDSEWGDVSDLTGHPFWQNKRDSRVFKHADGSVTFNDALVWEEEDGGRITGCVSGFTSSQPITLPCTPKTRYVKVTRLPTDDPDDWQFKISDPLEEAELQSLYPRP